MNIRRDLSDFLWAIVLVAISDIALFHQGAYFPLMQPQSHSGRVEQRSHRLEAMINASPDVQRVVVMGNSKAGAAVHESRLETELAAAGRPARVIDYSIGGTSPRGWYVLIKNSGVSGDNTRVVVVAVDDHQLRAESSTQKSDIEIVKTRATVADGFALAGASEGFRFRLWAAFSAIYRTPLFRDDLRQALEKPALRRRQIATSQARLERQLRAGFRFDNHETKNLLSARLGPEGQMVIAELDPYLQRNMGLRLRIARALVVQRKTREAIEQGRPKPRVLRPSAGKLKLLGRLTENLNRQGVKVVISMLPRGPYVLDRPLKEDPLAQLVTDLKRRGADVEVWRADKMLSRLQSPEYYRDDLHMNKAGADIYTRHLGRYLASVLDAGPGERSGDPTHEAASRRLGAGR